MPPLPASFCARLLPTETDSVDPAAAAAIREFCEASPEVEVAYVCSQEHTGADVPLRLAFKLVAPVSEPADSRATQRDLVHRLGRTQPELLHRFGGLVVIADRAVPAWNAYGIRVFERRPPG
ncbi:MAG: hypothetical protein JO073_00100 [Actinobacteria bacterium]|nr:hypothetical protein [Actinomycetota bacterium]